MNKAIGLTILVVGIGLLIYGANASDSVSSSLSKFFTGNPTDKTIWMLLGGAAATICGAVLALMPARKL
jgi:amino acid permease